MSNTSRFAKSLEQYPERQFAAQWNGLPTFIIGTVLFFVGLIGIINASTIVAVLPIELATAFILSSVGSCIYGLTQFIPSFEIAILIVMRPFALWAKSLGTKSG